MRFRYYFVATDLAGNVVEDAAISVYLAGTTTPATIYLSRTSTEGISTVPQLYSGADGRVVFWVDSDDYSYGQLFKIVVEKEELSFQIDDVQIIVWDAVKAVDADTVDTFHASQTPQVNTIPVSKNDGKIDVNWVSQGSGSGLDADKLDGQEGSYYLNRANHTGTQSPSTISPQGSGSGLDADKLDGYHASQTPTANTIPVAGSDGKIDEGWLPEDVTLDNLIVNNKVGIGTTPTFELDVAGNIRADNKLTFTASSYPGVVINVPDTSYLRLGGKSLYKPQALIVGDSYANDPGRLVFRYGAGGARWEYTDGSSNSEKMRITPAGNVGIGTTEPNSFLHCYGSFATRVHTVTVDTTLGANHHVVLVNASDGNRTITLPNATTCKGRQYIIKKIDSSSNTVTISAQSEQTIDGQSSVDITEQYGIVRVVSDGSNWYTF